MTRPDPGDAAYRAWQLTKNGDRMAQYGHPWDDYTMVRRIFGVGGARAIRVAREADGRENVRVVPPRDGG